MGDNGIAEIIYEGFSLANLTAAKVRQIADKLDACRTGEVKDTRVTLLELCCALADAERESSRLYRRAMYL